MNAPEIILDPNANIAELLSRWPQMIPVFIRHQMSCVGCSMSPFDTLKDVSFTYGLKLEDFILELKETLTPEN
jgi:hybrid cluster-associated redox disulfide protein